MLFETDRFRLEIDDSRGGKIVEIFDKRLGRNMLLDERMGSALAYEDGARFSVCGWDEALPTLEPWSEIPTLGYAWRISADSQVYSNGVQTKWSLPGWHLERDISIEDSVFTAGYRITNLSDEAVPMIWAGHALFPTDGLIEVSLPGGELIPGPYCNLNTLRQLLSADACGWRVSDFTSDGIIWKFFVGADSEVRMCYADATLAIRTEAPWLGIWLNRGKIGGLNCVGIEPTSAPTDYLQKSDCVIPGRGVFTTTWSLRVDIN